VFGQPYEDICRRYIALRYCLLPYVYTAFAECARHGWPIVRPPAFLDPALADWDDEYMLGAALLAAPVVEPGASVRGVHLPPGAWYDYWSGGVLEGGRVYDVAAPLETLPLYVRAGSVIPHWPELQHTGEKPVDELTLRVYAGDGHSPLYEDAGEGKEYLAGACRWSRFVCATAPERFEVRWEREGAYAPGYRRICLQIFGLARPPRAVTLDGAPVEWSVQSGYIEIVTGREFGRVCVDF